MSTLIKFPDAWKRRWEQFLAPTLLLPEGDRQRARLLTTITFALLLSLIPFTPIWVSATGIDSYSLFVMGLIFALVIMALIFSRTRYYRWSVRCLILMMICAVSIVFVVSYFRDQNPVSMFKYLMFGVFLASLILSMRETITIAVIEVVLIYFVCRVAAVPRDEIIINELAFSSVSSILIILSAFIREQYVNQLQTSGHRYHALFEQSNDAVFILDLQGKHLALNRRAVDMLGYEHEELLKRNYRDTIVVVTPEQEHAEDIRRRLLSGESIPPYERHFRRKDGAIIPVEINVELVRDAGNQPMHLQSIVRELTVRKRDEDARIQVRLERERSQILANFLRGAAHEFRTPLSVISANTYLLTRDGDPNNKTRRLNVIDQQVDRVNRLVDLMLMMVKLDSGEALSYEHVHVNTLMSGIIDFLRPLTAEKSLQLTLELMPDLPSIQGEPLYLAEAFRHIVQNAIQYTPDNGFIAVTTTVITDCIQVAIQDTGIGFASEQQERIFERFYRTDEAHSTEGFGLGLSIARAAILRHDGRIEVSSNPGVGSTFRIILPIIRADILHKTKV